MRDSSACRRGSQGEEGVQQHEPAVELAQIKDYATLMLALLATIGASAPDGRMLPGPTNPP